MLVDFCLFFQWTMLFISSFQTIVMFNVAKVIQFPYEAIYKPAYLSVQHNCKFTYPHTYQQNYKPMYIQNLNLWVLFFQWLFRTVACFKVVPMNISRLGLALFSTSRPTTELTMTIHSSGNNTEIIISYDLLTWHAKDINFYMCPFLTTRSLTSIAVLMISDYWKTKDKTKHWHTRETKKCSHFKNLPILVFHCYYFIYYIGFGILTLIYYHLIYIVH